jgi:hypothetical protein
MTLFIQIIRNSHLINYNIVRNSQQNTLHPSYSERVGAGKTVHYNRVFTITEFTINRMKCISILTVKATLKPSNKE